MSARFSGPSLLLSVFLLSQVVSAAAGTPPTEASLREAWEKLQRSDRQTETFEKVAEDRYRFKTKRFPFDGEVRVLSLEVGEPGEMPWQEGFISGTVNVELVGGSEEVCRLHPQAYGLWTASNALYYDQKAGRWLSAREFAARAARQSACSPWLAFLSGNLFWFLFLGFLIVFLGLLSRKANRQMKSAMAAQDKVIREQERAMKIAERGLEISEDSNRLLREILDALQTRDRG